MGGLSIEAAHYYARIYAAARARCLAELRRAGCGEADAEDIFAATLERIMRKFDPADSTYVPAQTVALLRKACLQKLIDERRHQAVLKMVPLEEASAKPREGIGPAEAVEEREAVAMGREAIASLPERDRALFYQRHQLQLSPEEIVRRNPGLSQRTYRKVIGRANARALRAFEEIEGGERCAQIRGGQLRRFVTDEADAEEVAAVRRHLLRCPACRSEATQMRIHLHDIASGLAAVLAVQYAHGGFLTGHALALWSDALGRAETLGAGLRSARGRLRELALTVATALPGSGGEASAGQIAGVSALKAASACTAGVIAVGCIAAGVVPDLGGQHRRAPAQVARHHHRSAQALPASSETDAVSLPTNEATAVGATEGGQSATSAHTGGGKVQHSSPAVSPRASGARAEPTPPVANEFGVESAGGSSSPSPSAPSPGVRARPSSGAKVAPAKSAGTGASAGSEDSSEFGF